MVKEELNITTYDNPFDPYVDTEEWTAFDMQKGYNTWCNVVRIACNNNPNVLATHLKDEQFDEAIKELVASNPNVYKLLRKQIEVDDYDIINDTYPID